jgi:hypothetical protein
MGKFNEENVKLSVNDREKLAIGVLAGHSQPPLRYISWNEDSVVPCTGVSCRASVWATQRHRPVKAWA